MLIQATEQVELNTLDPTLHDVPGGADGETGHAVAAQVGLYPPNSFVGTSGYQTGGTVGSVSGVAISGDGLTRISFSGPITIDNSLTSASDLPSLQQVNGAAVDLAFSQLAKVLELRVDPRLWLDSVDFGF